jgi:RNA polymerase sigma-70 factor (ECF subfamily)
MTPSPEAAAALSRLYLARAPVGAGVEGAALDEALRRLFAEGRGAWPALDLSAETFVGHLAAHRVLDEPSGRVHAADLYLAAACAAGVSGAIEAFERAHLRRVGSFLAQMRPAASLVDEVTQILREKLFVGRDGRPPRIAEYGGRGALASWLRVMAVRAAIDLRRAGGEAAAEAGEDPESRSVPSAEADPEIAYIKQRYAAEINEAFRRAAAALGEEQRELLRLHFIEGATLEQLAARLGVHRATVARRIAAAREAVADEARRILEARLGARTAELRSLVGLVRSQLDLSLPGSLRT